ncbi:hypothetical protein JMUB6875_32480 [Nocardia sp. JMUB6875]|uniref:STAS domain-containing protein n=1 Tax=Nocardia sp. JMUB6875 TaxID=3158170 RepID=UPI0032E79B51
MPGRFAEEIPPVTPTPGASPPKVRPEGNPRTNGHARTHRVESPDCVVVQVDGELDITGLADFRRALDFAISGGGPQVVVDLRRARFLSLRNAAVLAEAIDRAGAADIEIQLLTRSRQIERALEVTGARARAERAVVSQRS